MKISMNSFPLYFRWSLEFNDRDRGSPRQYHSGFSLLPHCSLTHSSSHLGPLSDSLSLPRSAVHRRTLNQMGIKLSLESQANSGRLGDGPVHSNCHVFSHYSHINLGANHADQLTISTPHKQETPDTFL